MGKYLYNGVLLPDINSVWTNKETHPHAVISMLDSSTYALYIAESYEYSDYLDSTGYLYLVLNNYVRYTCVSGAQAWEGELALSQVTFLLKRTDSGNTSIPVWASFNIEYAGTLYLAASDLLPVGKPITNPLSFAMGWQLGCRLRAQRAVTTAIGYLYNGVRLPKIPEVEGYAYRFMTIMVTSSSTSAYLYCSNVPIYKNDVASLFASIIAKADGNVICYPCDVLPDGTVVNDWHRYENGDKTFTADTKFMVTNTGSIKWANYDILNYSDDSVYLAASDPVPIYK